MASVSVTNTFTANTTASASEVNTNFTDLVTYINNRNDSSAVWEALYCTTSARVPMRINNSSGANDIAQFQDNGTTTFAILDKGEVNLTIPDGADLTDFAMTILNSETTSGESNGLLIKAGDVVTDVIFQCKDINGSTWFSVFGDSTIEIANSAPVTFAVNKGTDFGTASFAANTMYADDFTNVADFPFLDNRKDKDGKVIAVNDLEVIKGIKQSSSFNEVTGLQIIDDYTLPDWIISHNKKTKEPEKDENGKPLAVPLKNLIMLNMGAIRQLDARLEGLEKKNGARRG